MTRSVQQSGGLGRRAVLGWALLAQDLNLLQIAGMVVVLASVWLSQWAQSAPAAKTVSPRAAPSAVRPSAL